MSAENEPVHADGDPVHPLEALQGLVRTPAGRAHVLRQVDAFIDHPEETPENLHRARSLIRDGYVPVLYANHQSHADKLVLSGIIQSLVADDLETRISQFLVPVAATIESGAQGDYIQQLLPLFDPLYRDRGYGPDVPIITPNDRQARGVEGSNTESIRRLMNAPVDKHGLVMFPEATLAGGRRADDGAVNGMREVTSITGSGLVGYPKYWRKRKLGEAVYLPVGISGSYRLYPPDPGRSVIPVEVIADIVAGGPVEPLVTVSLGRPFTFTELTDAVGGEPDHREISHLDLMMGKVADLLPPEERGRYTRPTG